jgi:hypothetical protein
MTDRKQLLRSDSSKIAGQRNRTEKQTAATEADAEILDADRTVQLAEIGAAALRENEVDPAAPIRKAVGQVHRHLLSPAALEAWQEYG